MPYYQIDHSVDPYTFIAPNDKIAVIIGLLMDPGWSLKDEYGNVLKPDFTEERDKLDLYSIKTADLTRCGKWFQERYDMPFSYAVETYLEVLVPSLNNFVFGDISDRRRFDRALEEVTAPNRSNFIELWNEGRESHLDLRQKGCSIARGLKSLHRGT